MTGGNDQPAVRVTGTHNKPREVTAEASSVDPVSRLHSSFKFSEEKLLGIG